jgi:hypothetical protein
LTDSESPAAPPGVAAAPGPDPVPGHLVGAWRRVGLVVDGVVVDETLDVLWLQGPEWYADIRLPLAADTGPEVAVGTDADGGQDGPSPGAAPLSSPMAFAGPAAWSEPMMGWTHVFDSAGRPTGVDAGQLSFDDDVLIETGQWSEGDRVVTYIERWARLDDEPATVEHWPAGVTVSAGPRRIVIDDHRPDGTFTAIRLSGDGDRRWVETGRLTVDR